MANKLEPLNMTGHANTWEEELQEVCAERDALRAELAATREVIEAARRAEFLARIKPAMTTDQWLPRLSKALARLDAATGPRPEPRKEQT